MPGRNSVGAGEVKAHARALGFSHAGIARAQPEAEDERRLREWLGRGFAASMGWMERTAAKRGDPQRVLPGARSIIAVAMNYYTAAMHTGMPGTGKVSRYAWGDDYHAILGAKLRQLWEWIGQSAPGAEGLWYVDTGPVMEKVWAQRAGIGWQGKHTNIITKDRGSWVFLGEVITTLDLEPDLPAADHCGDCTLCIEACPTGAIVEPYVIDSGRCLSYLTIEHRGPIEPDLAARFEGWMFGCDICQDVCPWNHRFAEETGEPGFRPREGMPEPDLQEIAGLTEEEFTQRFAGSPVRRARRDGLARNAQIVREAST